MNKHDDDLLARVKTLLSGSEVDDQFEEEFELREARRQIGLEEQYERESLEEHLEGLAAAEDPEEIDLWLDGLEAWLLSWHTPEFVKRRIRRAIRDRFGEGPLL